jgi:hypothetical protein
MSTPFGTNLLKQIVEEIIVIALLEIVSDQRRLALDQDS